MAQVPTETLTLFRPLAPTTISLYRMRREPKTFLHLDVRQCFWSRAKRANQARGSQLSSSLGGAGEPRDFTRLRQAEQTDRAVGIAGGQVAAFRRESQAVQ